MFARSFAGAMLALVCLLASPALAQAPSTASPVQPDYSWQDAIPHQSGRVSLPSAHASLSLGKGYYFVDAAGARKILVDGWGNPPQAAEGVLGMIFPQRFKPMDEAAWGAVVTFEDTGWVSDKDAASADYDELLSAMRDGQEKRNAERLKAGYPTVDLIGWAERPSYNASNHVAIWARELSFNGDAEHGLNYDIRVLGRHGVLSLNVVSGMADLTEIHGVAGEIASTAAFTQGAAYADYQPGVDKSAGYGIAGLIAAGAGVAAVKKLGILGILLAFGKKFVVFLIAGFGAIVAWARRLLGGRSAAASSSPARPSIFDEPAPADDQKPAGGSGSGSIVT